MEEVTSRLFAAPVPLVPSASPFPSLAPQLIVLSQKIHAEETITKNGIPKKIQLVVKNSPFHYALGITNAAIHKLDFNQIYFDATLIYDCEGDKEVDFVRAKPFEFKPTASEDGQTLDVELRIKVLSSQHEDMPFRVKLKGFQPITRQEIPGICFISPPIKVISKPEQIKKKQSPPIDELALLNNSNSSSADSNSKKRTLTDMLIETVQRIEKKQEAQQQLIENIMTEQINGLGNQFPVSMRPPTLPSAEKRQRIDDVNDSDDWDPTSDDDQEILQRTEPNRNIDQPRDNRNRMSFSPKESNALAVNDGPEFEDAFDNLISIWNTIKSDDRSDFVRQVIRGSSSRETETLSDLLDLFWTEGLQREPSFANRTNARDRLAAHAAWRDETQCCCADCPHKQELQRIDEFYREFLVNASSMPATPY